MELAIDQDELNGAFGVAAKKAVEEAMQSWDMKQKLIAGFSSTVSAELIGKVVDDAVGQLDLTAISTALAKEISKTAVGAVTHMLREWAVESAVKLRGISSYDDKAITAARKELWAKMFKECDPRTPPLESPGF